MRSAEKTVCSRGLAFGRENERKSERIKAKQYPPSPPVLLDERSVHSPPSFSFSDPFLLHRYDFKHSARIACPAMAEPFETGHHAKLEPVRTHESGSANGEPLSRQMTISISPEQYERLFFQPTPARGDLAKRLGNPTLLGLCGFLIPFQTTMFCCLGWQGASVPSTVAISGTYYFLGGIAMNVAGICEFILGNTYPFAVFVVFGCHWCNLAFSTDPAHNLGSAFGEAGAASIAFQSGTGFYNVTMSVYTISRTRQISFAALPLPSKPKQHCLRKNRVLFYLFICSFSFLNNYEDADAFVTGP